MTKEDILKKALLENGIKESGLVVTYPATAIGVAMDQYAEQEAIEFAEWIREGEYHPRDMSDKPNWIQAASKIGWLQPGHSIVHSTNQLYQLFKTQKS